MRATTLIAGAVTALVAGFLIIPVLVSILAGLSESYARGPMAGLTLTWVAEVWRLYSGTIFRSILVALATLAITLIIGVPAAYGKIGRAHV